MDDDDDVERVALEMVGRFGAEAAHVARELAESGRASTRHSPSLARYCRCDRAAVAKPMTPTRANGPLGVFPLCRPHLRGKLHAVDRVEGGPNS